MSVTSTLNIFRLPCMQSLHTWQSGAVILVPYPASAHLFEDRIKVSSSVPVPLPSAPSAFSQRNVLHLLRQGPAVAPAHGSDTSILGALIAWEAGQTSTGLKNLEQGKLGICGPLTIIPETVIGRQVPPCAAQGRGRRCVPVLLSIKQAAAG